MGEVTLIPVDPTPNEVPYLKIGSNVYGDMSTQIVVVGSY